MLIGPASNQLLEVDDLAKCVLEFLTEPAQVAASPLGPARGFRVRSPMTLPALRLIRPRSLRAALFIVFAKSHDLTPVARHRLSNVTSAGDAAVGWDGRCRDGELRPQQGVLDTAGEAAVDPGAAAELRVEGLRARSRVGIVIAAS